MLGHRVVRFRFRCYRRADGSCVLNQFLAEQRSNRRLVIDTIATLRQLRNPSNHRDPIMKSLSPWKFYEARPNGARVFFIRRGDLLVFLSAALCSEKKQNKLPRRVFNAAENMRNDYEERCTHEEAGWDEDIPCDHGAPGTVPGG